jgi:thiamine-phosphate pyrophosphorylase
MTHRQSEKPSEWLILDARLGDSWRGAVRKLPRGSGVLVLRHELSARDRRKLIASMQPVARTRRLRVIDEGARSAARVHNARELRLALTARVPLILLSPIFATRSHAEWKPLPRMRAAALARLAKRRAFALGGMNRRRFRSIQELGFIGWAGIDAWIRT